MRVVVTGGAGFIGANLCRKLEQQHQADVVVVDDLSTGFRENLAGLEVHLCVASILEPDFSSMCAGADAIVHLAALPSVARSVLDPVSTHEANATGTLRVLEAARRHACQVIVASSSSVYGANRELPKRETAVPMPMSPYAVSKLAAESYTLAYRSCFGLPGVAFRFFNVFGPLQAAGHAYAAVIPAFIDAALRGEPLLVHGDGLQTRDFTYVDTLTDVISDAIHRRISCDRPVNLAYGTRTSLRELISLLEGLLEHQLPVQAAPSRPGDVRDSQADNSTLRSLFPAIAPTNLEDGLRATLEWFRSPSGGRASQHGTSVTVEGKSA